MSLNNEALRSSFYAVAPKADELTETFYATLFVRYPAVVPLFEGTDMAAQRRMLANAIKTIIDSLEDLEAATKFLKAMGKRHIDYGTAPEHYPAVGECLLHALSTVAGDLWTEELEAEWAKAYGLITELMIEGAKEAQETVTTK